jgi:hypothetical protein
MKKTKIFIQFIPIIIIFMLLSYSKQFVNFSFTILGKLIAIMIIIFYSYNDIILGLCVCGLVILYYQSDYVENMLNMDDYFDMNDVLNYDLDNMLTNDNIEDNNVNNDYIDDGLYLVPNSENTKFKNSKKIKNHKRDTRSKCENMQNYLNTDNGNMVKNDLISRFIKDNCVKGELKYKDMTVKKDMIEHIFQEISFNTDQPCNPCSMKCNYSIIEGKIKSEEKMKPISTSQ